MHRFAYGLMIGSLLCGCQPARDTPARHNADSVRHAIDSLNTRLEAWYAAGQIDSVAAVFAQDARQMPPNMAPLVGRDAIRGFWTNAVTWGRWSFDLTTEEVLVADSLAVERGRFTLGFQAKAGAPMPSFQDRGNYVVVWRFESPGQWRIVWDAPVSELPVAGTSPANPAVPPVTSPGPAPTGATPRPQF